MALSDDDPGAIRTSPGGSEGSDKSEASGKSGVIGQHLSPNRERGPHSRFGLRYSGNRARPYRPFRKRLMRVDFCKAMYQVLKRDPCAALISGDLGFNAFEEIVATYGRRFLNAGVAEQNMMGVAAGMACTGLHPWIYSIIPFVTLRCLEQIRNDVCFHNLPVRIVGNGGGFTYGVLGSTHHALEDLGVMKTLPNLTLFFPSAGDQVATAMDRMDQSTSPTYLRLAISPFATARKPLAENPKTLTRRFHQGSEVTVIGVGHAVQIALTALEKAGCGDWPVDIFGITQYPFDLKSDEWLI